MEDVNISKYRAQVVRAGSTPASPGFAVAEGQNPVDPSGSGQTHLPVTIATAATGLSITESQILSGAGLVSQYIRGDGSLADFPATTGGGSSVSYYLNGSVSQGTIGGVAYKQLNRTPVFGAGTDISINADGYIASFITDASDPNKLLIPAGNWNFETYFSASSNGGSPSFYVELYKYDGTTFTLIATSSSAPELIAFGTSLNPYYSTLAVPQTALALTDRLAIRYFVTHSGRTITLHTEDNHLCQIITTFTTGLTALNGLTAQVQNFAVGTSGTDFAIASATATHTFNLPTASATNRGALSSADWTTFNGKQNALTNPVTGTGTTNYLSKFTGASTIGNSLIFDNGTNVGINTNNPSAWNGNQGTIVSQYSATGNAIYSLQSNTTVVNTGAVFEGFSNAVTSGSKALGSIAFLRENTSTTALNSFTGFYTNNAGSVTEKMRFTSLGRLILYSGTFSDNGATLQVSGTATVSSSVTVGGYLTGQGTNPGGLGGSRYVLDWLSGSMRVFSYGADASTNGGFLLNSQRSDGTNSINYLNIASTGESTFSSTVTATSLIKSGGTSSQFLKADGSVDSSTYLTTSSAASTYVTLGTAQTITGLKTFSTSGVNMAEFTSTNATGGVIFLGRSGVGVGNIGNSGSLTVGILDDLEIRSGSSKSIHLRTDAVQFTLSPSGGAATIFSANSSTPILFLNTPGTNQASGIVTQQNGGSRWGFGANFGTGDDSFNIYNYGVASRYLTIASTGAATFSGDVTISKTSPTFRLTRGITSSSSLLVYNTNGTDDWLVGTGVTGSNTNYRVYNNSLGADAIFVVNSNNNVLIGTTTDNGAKLQVNGNANFTSAPSLGGYQVQALSNSGGSTSYGGLVVQSVNGKAGYLTCGDNSTATWYGAQASFVTLGATLGAGIKLRVNADDNTGIIIGTNGIIDLAGPLVVRGTLPADQTDAAVIDHNGSTMRIFSYGVAGVTGDFQFRTAAGGAGSNLVSTINGTTGVYVAVSDINKKKDFEQSTIGLNAILGLKPTLYRMKNDNPNSEKQLGFIAQEVKDYIKQAYVEKDDFIGLNYNSIIPVLVKAIQELNEKIK